MNTNPKAIRILCYGDSNTWGDPALGKPRFAANVRWPGKLQEILGNDYEIIEEGLMGRTTDLEDPKREGRNGKSYLAPCLETHKPIDFFILLLGTNDLKKIYDRKPEQVANSIDSLIEIVEKSEAGPGGNSPQIILLSPILIKDKSILAFDKYDGGPGKSKQFGVNFEKVAKRHNCIFIDLARHVEPGIDGGHLNAEGHSEVAELVAKKIKHNNA